MITKSSENFEIKINYSEDIMASGLLVVTSVGKSLNLNVFKLQVLNNTRENLNNLYIGSFAYTEGEVLDYHYNLSLLEYKKEFFEIIDKVMEECSFSTPVINLLEPINLNIS